MRAPRIEGNVILADAKLRRAALACADLSVCEAWPPEFDAALRDRMPPRLEKRLFASLVESSGDPAVLETDVRLLIGMTDSQRQRAAVTAGLIYHLPAMGAVIGRGAMDALTALFGKLPLSIALSYAHLSPIAAGSLDVSGEELRQLVEADGWVILDLWAAEQGLARNWRGWSRRAGSGSLSLVASAAVAIASAVVRHGELFQGEAR